MDITTSYPNEAFGTDRLRHAQREGWKADITLWTWCIRMIAAAIGTATDLEREVAMSLVQEVVDYVETFPNPDGSFRFPPSLLWGTFVWATTDQQALRVRCELVLEDRSR